MERKKAKRHRRRPRVEINVIPRSLSAAEKERGQRIYEIQKIEGELGDRESVDVYGNVRSPSDYAAWRRKAIAAKIILERRLRFLNRWIAGERRNAFSSSSPPKSTFQEAMHE